MKYRKNKFEEVYKMKVNITNNVSNINVIVNQSKDGSVDIHLNPKGKKLGDFKLGETVRLGKHEYIVLDHGADTTAVITKDFTKKMEFGQSGDYLTSDVRKYCNGEFYNELVVAVGAENIVKHTVKLVANDGTGKGKTCYDNVSIITTENYRRYREFLEAYGDWWWTATRVTYNVESYSRSVCSVCSDGILDWNDCGYCFGVRPFCILNSSVLIS